MLTFSERGVLDTDALMRQAAAALDTVHPQTRSKGSTVLDARSRFVVSGGRWKPTPVLEAEMQRRGLGKAEMSRTQMRGQGTGPGLAIAHWRKRGEAATEEKEWPQRTQKTQKSRKISREGAKAQRAFGVSDLPKLINFSPSHTAHSVRLASQTSGPRLLLLNFSVGLRSGVCNSSL